MMLFCNLFIERPSYISNNLRLNALLRTAEMKETVYFQSIVLVFSVVLMQLWETTERWWNVVGSQWQWVRRIFAPHCVLCCWTTSWLKAG